MMQRLVEKPGLRKSMQYICRLMPLLDKERAEVSEEIFIQY